MLSISISSCSLYSDLLMATGVLLNHPISSLDVCGSLNLSSGLCLDLSSSITKCRIHSEKYSKPPPILTIQKVLFFPKDLDPEKVSFLVTRGGEGVEKLWKISQKWKTPEKIQPCPSICQEGVVWYKVLRVSFNFPFTSITNSSSRGFGTPWNLSSILWETGAFLN